MSLSLCLWNKGRIRAEAQRLGAVAFGCSVAGPVDSSYADRYDRWIASGAHGTMDYLARHTAIRRDPRLLLPGARTVISLAFPYRPAGGYHHPWIADYALGRDYHTVLHGRLRQLAAFMADNFGAQSRPCVDSAPIAERYWAHRSGLGFIGLNGQLIVPGVGSGVFLAELVTTLELAPDSPLAADCGRCGACVRACPGSAISPDGSFDGRRCLSYLGIEHRGEFPSGAPSLGTHIYGCDECQRVCPHNHCEPPEPLTDFYPDHRLLTLDAATIRHFSRGDWRRLSSGSAMRRISLSQMLRTYLQVT